jgi:hypothetical protein
MRGLVILIVLAAFVGLIVWLRRRRSKNIQAVVQDSLPKVRAFLQTTGYAFADARSALLDMQAQRWQDAYLRSVSGQGYKVHLIRNYRGVELHWHHASGRGGPGLVYSQTWRAQVLPAPRLHFHISERTNLTKTSQGWQPAFPRAIGTGDPTFDGRFVVFTPHDERAVQTILANPQFRQALFSFHHVDLRVVTDGVIFSDPMQRNTIRALGENWVRYLGDPGTMFEASLPVHEQVASFMLGAASLAS